MTDHVRVERGRYHDSVTLMRASAAAAEVAGITGVVAAMATELNRGLLAAEGFAVPTTSPDDLVVAVRAADDASLAAAVATVERVLAERPGTGRDGGRRVPVRTVESAVAAAPGATVVVVSVPGAHAYVEAAAALRAGRHVMVFSDGVSLADEVALKAEAATLGLLVMGPDCGTVVLDGVGLGFANVVVPGPVGIVGASGTGAQQLCALLDGAGIGVRHLLGVGGRDLSDTVGGVSTLAALAALDADTAVEVIVVVSKPPAPAVADIVTAAARACATPVVLAFVGPGRPSLTVAAGVVAATLGRSFDEPARWSPPAPLAARPGRLLGLCSGGTDCVEAIAVVEARLGPVRANVHPDLAQRVGADDVAPGEHVLLDLGDDDLTVGRPHPMIDPRPVADRLAAAATDDTTGVVLLDVVLGHASHPDPASVLAAAVAAATAAGIAVVVALIGTAGDPQGLERQAAALVAAGAAVHRGVAGAADHAAGLAAATATAEPSATAIP